MLVFRCVVAELSDVAVSALPTGQSFLPPKRGRGRPPLSKQRPNVTAPNSDGNECEKDLEIKAQFLHEQLRTVYKSTVTSVVATNSGSTIQIRSTLQELNDIKLWLEKWISLDEPATMFIDYLQEYRACSSQSSDGLNTRQHCKQSLNDPTSKQHCPQPLDEPTLKQQSKENLDELTRRHPGKQRLSEQTTRRLSKQSFNKPVTRWCSKQSLDGATKKRHCKQSLGELTTKQQDKQSLDEPTTREHSNLNLDEPTTRHHTKPSWDELTTSKENTLQGCCESTKGYKDEHLNKKQLFSPINISSRILRKHKCTNIDKSLKICETVTVKNKASTKGSSSPVERNVSMLIKSEDVHEKDERFDSTMSGQISCPSTYSGQSKTVPEETSTTTQKTDDISRISEKKQNSNSGCDGPIKTKRKLSKSADACNRCNLCCFVTANRKYLDIHVKRRHVPKEHACTECDKRYALLMDLNYHVAAVHQGEFICNTCSMKCQSSRALEWHVRKKHDRSATAEMVVRVYKCPECEFTTTSAANLHLHYVRRHAERNFQCALCGNRFGLLKDLKQHCRSHTKICYCDVCGKSLRSRQALEWHIDAIHRHVKRKEAKPYLCNLCGRLCHGKTNYTNHRNKAHLDVRPYVCQICGQSVYYFCLSTGVHSNVSIMWLTFLDIACNFV